MLYYKWKDHEGDKYEFSGNKKNISDIIRGEFKAKNLEVKQIVLFGSQSRENAGPDSDWDFLVSIGKELEFREKTKIITAIQRRLALKRISVDIIIKSEEKIAQERNNVGVITYYALKNGILV
jgi:predicted nucleotidyltransferase